VLVQPHPGIDCGRRQQNGRHAGTGRVLRTTDEHSRTARPTALVTRNSPMLAMKSAGQRRWSCDPDAEHIETD
jgi:hypothetical protein